MPSTIFSGDKVKALKKKLKLGEGAEIISTTVDPTASGLDAPIGTIALNETNGSVYSKTGAGTTAWTYIVPTGTAVTGLSKSGSSALTGNVTLSGDGIVLTQSGQDIKLGRDTALLANFSSTASTAVGTSYTDISTAISIPSITATKTSPINVLLTGRALVTGPSTTSASNTAILSDIYLKLGGTKLTPTTTPACIPAFPTIPLTSLVNTPAQALAFKTATASAAQVSNFIGFAIPFVILNPTIGDTYTLYFQSIRNELAGGTGTASMVYVTMTAAHV